MSLTVGRIANILDVSVPISTQDLPITGINILGQAKAGELSFYASDKYKSELKNTAASAVIIGANENLKTPFNWVPIHVPDVYHALATVLNEFKVADDFSSSISDTAVIDQTSILESEVHIGHHVIIAANAKISKGVVLMGNNYIGANVELGENTVLFPGVTVLKDCVLGKNVIIHANTVIGSDGFGYVFLNGKYEKIPQIGNVILEDDVEIGSNCSIDRASIGSTLIQKGAKLDNLIQIAHNVEIGANTVMAAQSGVAGSTKIGDFCQVGGQAGIVGHLKIANQTKIQAQSGVTKNIKKEGSKLYGYPAIEYNNYLRSYAAFKNLPDLMAEMQKMKKELDQLKKKK